MFELPTRAALVASAFLAALSVVPTRAGEPTAIEPDLRTRLAELIESKRVAQGFPGAVIAIARDGQPVIAVACGSADLEGKRPLTTDALFLAGSTGKTFYAALALRLVGEKKLDLDAPIAKYLGKEKWFERLRHGEAITVKMLMNHTSGIERYELDPRFLEVYRKDPLKRFTIEERIEYVLDRDPPFEPGKGWVYSDTNYIVLGAILNGLCEKDLETEIHDRFLAPLELRHVAPSSSRRIDGLVQGHAGLADPFVPADETIGADGALVLDPSFEWAGGGYATAAPDLARWCLALHGGDVLAAELRDRMHDGVPCPLGKETRYGLGTIVWRTRHGVAFGHSGFFPGYVSEMRYYESLRAAIAIQLNTSDSRQLRPLGQILDDAADLLDDSK